ncbi:YfjI family protein [Rhizobium leguminosarum]
MNAPTTISIADYERAKNDWPTPDARYLRSDIPEPPSLPLEDVFSPRWARWMRIAAEAKAAPPDYVMAAVMACCGSLIGNARWANPWHGWAEPPVLWAAAIGSPSSCKSPALDAVLGPLKAVERSMRAPWETSMADWRQRAEIAKLAETAWKDDVKAALKAGKKAPARPDGCDAGPEPKPVRLSVTDTTVEKLALIVGDQPRGTLLARDELAGWLSAMNRYSGGSDRPFWLESYGGRSYTVERMGRDSVYIGHLTVGVLGGIQPDKLRPLLTGNDDDGLLARLMPIWPNPAPVKRPDAVLDEAFIEDAMRMLLSLQMPIDEDGSVRPWFIPFSDDAKGLLDQFREDVRQWEGKAEGLLLSFVGKLPGLAVRISLVLAMMDYASGESSEPAQISIEHFGRAAHFIESYLLPMAQRAYADASVSTKDRSARNLVKLIISQEMRQFSTRDILRMDQKGFSTASELDPLIKILEEADVLRQAPSSSSPQGGRPAKVFLVNPALHGRRS